MEKTKRIRIITGHYGSGKSEFSINYALKLRKEVEGRLAISDLDVVNVYFRSRGRKEFLEENGIHLISSSVDAPTLDIPALSAEIHTPLLNKDYNNIIDLGGVFEYSVSIEYTHQYIIYFSAVCFFSDKCTGSDFIRFVFK